MGRQLQSRLNVLASCINWTSFAQIELTVLTMADGPDSRPREKVKAQWAAIDQHLVRVEIEGNGGESPSQPDVRLITVGRQNAWSYPSPFPDPIGRESLPPEYDLLARLALPTQRAEKFGTVSRQNIELVQNSRMIPYVR